MFTLPLEKDRAWAAGFWDGEGCTSITNVYRDTKKGRRVHKQMKLTLGQTEMGQELLTRFKYAVGGLGGIVEINRLPKDGKTFKKSWLWSTAGLDKIQTVIGTLWPYLSQPKKDQYKRVLKTYLDFRKQDPVYCEVVN